MKNTISLMLALILLSSPVYAAFDKPIKKIESGSLFADNADRLSYIEIPANEKFLPDFSAFTNLEKIKADETNPYYTSVDGVLFSKDKKTLICYPAAKTQTSYSVPKGVERIMSGAFYKNEYIKKISLPSSLTKLGANPFADCKSLEEINSESEVFSSQDGCLYDFEKTKIYACPASLHEINLPSGLTRICSGAFSGCRRIKNINIPKNVDSIESMAFNNCTNLSEITISGNIKSLNTSCFLGCTSLESITVAGSDYLKSNDGIVYSFDMLDLICCPKGKSGEIKIPDGVKNILNGAFDNCSKLTRIIFPESLEYIGRAFLNCTSLKNIEFPANQTIIEYGTLSGCSSLEWAYLPNNVVIIQNGAMPASKFTLLCDEDSFSEYYANENSIPHSYKYSIFLNGKTLSLSNQPFEKDNKIYLPVSELLEALGGKSYFNTSSLMNTKIGSISVKFDFGRIEKTINNLTEILNVSDMLYIKSEIYIPAEIFEEIFDIKINKDRFNINLGNQT